MDDLEFIKKFSKITLTEVCKKTGVNKPNLYMGKASKENIKKIRKQIENDVAELYIINKDGVRCGEDVLLHDRCN